MLGAIIKSKRLEQNLSQESLCKGICAVSYLSKIESGQVKPSTDVMNLLLQKLDIVLLSQMDAPEVVERKIAQLYESYCFGDFEGMKKVYITLPEALRYTEFAVDWHLLSAMHGILDENWAIFHAHTKTAEAYKPYFTSTQLHFFYLLKGIHASENKALSEALGFYNLALQISRSGLLLHMAASIEYLSGNYANTIRLGNEAYALLTKEGNLYYAIAATQILAAAYSNVKQLDSAIQLYQRLLHMGTYLKKEDLLNTVYYNLGATFLACKAFDQAASQFEMLIAKVDGFEHREWLMAYQKFVLCDIGLKNFEAAREKLSTINTRMHSMSLKQNNSLYQSIKWLNFFMDSDAPYDNPAYLDAIRATYALSKKDAHYGFTLFYSDYLIEALKIHRCYKEALEVKDSLK